ncbi:MAG: ribbon-helix-helix domain-containing protein, partial [Thermoanaerobaculia bacterium]
LILNFFFILGHLRLLSFHQPLSGPVWTSASEPYDSQRVTMTVIDIGETTMTQITARLPEELVDAIDAAAHRLQRSRSDLVRQALEYYLADLEDLRLGLERLQDPGDPVLDWEEVKRGLLAEDQG